MNPAFTSCRGSPQSQSARVIPQGMSKGAVEAKRKLEMAYRARAAHSMLGKKAKWSAEHSNADAIDPCTGNSIDGVEATE